MTGPSPNSSDSSPAGVGTSQTADSPGESLDGVTLVNGRTFVVARTDGSLRRASDGAVFEDLRMLSRLSLAVGTPETVFERQQLGQASITPFQASVLSRPDPETPGLSIGEYYVHRQWAGAGVRHDIELYVGDPVDRRVAVSFDTDFAHLFDVKAGRESSTRATLRWHDDRGMLADPDDPDRGVEVRATPLPTEVDVDVKRLTWDLRCTPGDATTVSLSFEPCWDRRPAGLAFPIGSPIAASWPSQNLEAWRQAAPTVTTEDARLGLAIDTSIADLASLRIFDPEHAERVVIAAGAPWYMTLFGRDSLLTSWMVMPFLPQLALGTLAALSDLQGTKDRAESEEQPGKIIHELRRHGGDAAFADRGRYYGTVDATPLFVMAAAEAHRWDQLVGDELAHRWANVLAAIGWVRRRMAADPGGFLTYHRSTEIGLVNQGWKDSWDGVNASDGRLPTGSVALVEVQGYAYAALRGAAEMARSLDEPGLDPDQLDVEADQLAERFDKRFWDARSSTYAVALDDGRRVDAVTTNPGHAIWCGIARPERAVRYLDRAMDELYTGWGLRTLSPMCKRYDPLSYHNGSVWPHDTAIVAAGAARVGRFDVVEQLFDAALEVAEQCAGRPPELFAGIAREVIDVPVAYPSSCSPQAWASASTLLHVRSLLQLSPPTGDGMPTVANTSTRSTSTLSGIRYGADRFEIHVGPEWCGVRVLSPGERSEPGSLRSLG